MNDLKHYDRQGDYASGSRAPENSRLWRALGRARLLGATIGVESAGVATTPTLASGEAGCSYAMSLETAP